MVRAGYISDHVFGLFRVSLDTLRRYDWEAGAGNRNRNALDGDATILVPQSMLDATTKGILFDVYIRVLGKPNQCMKIDGYAYDSATGYWLTGTLYISRKGGKSTFMKINDMFEVQFCATPPDCTPAETSVFADVFEDYFWSITNDGTRIVQVRIYPRSL